MAKFGDNRSEDELARDALDKFEKVEPPAGVLGLTKEHRELWDRFVTCRLPKDWTPMNLMMLGKVVNIEIDLREQKLILDDEGPVVYTSKGHPMANPRYNVCDSLQRMQLTLLKAIGLVIPPQYSTKMQEAAKDAAAKKQEMNSDSDDDDLLAGVGQEARH